MAGSVLLFVYLTKLTYWIPTMPLFHLAIIALIQGLTEFLPVSSSGHLILLPGLTGLEDQGTAIDVAAHVGTLIAVIFYFRSDVRDVMAGIPSLLKRDLSDKGAWLAFCLIVATIPVIIFGLVLKITGLTDLLRSIAVIGWTMLLFGLVLYWADRTAVQSKTTDFLSLNDSIKLGLWQMIALIPGTSRSGIVITGALRAGFTRTEAARIAMLMSIPTIIASGTLASLDLIGGTVPLRDVGIVAVLSCIAALFALRLMMQLLKSVSYTPYVIYRIVLGLILLWIAYV